MLEASTCRQVQPQAPVPLLPRPMRSQLPLCCSCPLLPLLSTLLLLRLLLLVCPHMHMLLLDAVSLLLSLVLLRPLPLRLCCRPPR